MKNIRLSFALSLLMGFGGAITATAQYFSPDNMMPSPHYSGINPVQFTSGVMLTSLDIDISNGRVAPPTGGTNKISSFFDIFVDIRLAPAGGSPTLYNGFCDGSVRIQDMGGGIYNTEMTQLDIRGGNLPAGVLLRESPTLASVGQTTITSAPGGFMITSFFDVFTELSLDGGQTWQPSSGPEHLIGGTPEPASALVLGGLAVGLLRRRKK